MRPVMIACAPNGARRLKRDHPALPLSTAEIAADARAVCAAGASLLHLHVRDDDGGHSLDAGRYREAIAAIEAETGDRLLVQITTEAVGKYAPEAQMQVVRDVRPQAASCALRELCPDDAAIASYARFLRECADADIWIQHILYDAEDAVRFTSLIDAGSIPDAAAFALLVLGSYAGASAPPDAAEIARRAAPMQARANVLWAACAFGPHEQDTLVSAAKLGGHVRVGFENNLHAPNGELAKSNADQVARLAAALRSAGMTPATTAQVSQMRARESTGAR